MKPSRWKKVLVILAAIAAVIVIATGITFQMRAVTVPFLDADLLKSACDHIGRPLTAEEWARHLPSREYEPRCR